MNIQSVYLGVSANDSSGDPLRVGGFKINDNFAELFTNNSHRHRHSLLVYPTLSGSPAFLEYSGLNVDLIAPLIGVIGQPYEERGERNLPFTITTDVLSAWTVPVSATSYLYVEKNSLSGSELYGYSPYEPRVSETSGTPVSGQHWYNVLENVMYEWDGADFLPVNRLFVASVIAVSSINSLSYIISNDESIALASGLSATYLSAVAYTDSRISSLSSTTSTLVNTASANLIAYADSAAKKWAIVLG